LPLENEEYPLLYFFKFIIPNDELKLAKLKDKFNSEDAEITTKNSKTGKYISLSIKEVMLSSDQIIETYKSVGEIEGVISL
jgi:putative lipoic acid-binding regulatory protein